MAFITLGTTAVIITMAIVAITINTTGARLVREPIEKVATGAVTTEPLDVIRVNFTAIVEAAGKR